MKGVMEVKSAVKLTAQDYINAQAKVKRILEPVVKELQEKFCSDDVSDLVHSALIEIKL